VEEKSRIRSGICRNKKETMYKVKTLKFQHPGFKISYFKSHFLLTLIINSNIILHGQSLFIN